MKKNYRGFTLVELMVVVCIISFLIVLGYLLTRSAMLKALDGKKKADIDKIQKAVEEYEKDNDCYPLPSDIICEPGTGLQPYLSKIPCDPVTKASYYFEIPASSCPSWYRIYSKLDYTQDKDIIPNIGPYGDFNFYRSSPNAPQIAVTNPPEEPTDGGGGDTYINYYGCKSGSCVQITWDANRPGPECDPQYTSNDCYNLCSIPGNECIPWK